MWYTQPQSGPVQVDWKNPLTKGALAVINAALQVNSVTGKPLKLTGTGFSRLAFPVGQAIDFNMNFYVETEVLPAIGTAAFVEFWVGYPTASLGPKGGTGAPKYLTGSGANNIGIVQKAPGSLCWGALNDFPSNAYDIASSDVLVSGVYTVLVSVRHANGARDIWHNGVLTQSFSHGPVALGASSMILGSFLGDTTYWSASSDTILAGRIANDWTDDNVKSFCANPWQLFRSPQRVMLASGIIGLISANGSSVGTSSLTAIANAVAQATGAAAGTSVTGGAARMIFNVAGSSNGTGSVGGTAVSITQATGAAVGVSGSAASAVSISTSNGSATGTATLAGSGNAIWRVSGSAASIATVLGTSNAVTGATTDASGNATGTSTANAMSGKIAGTAGAAYGIASITGQGQTLAQAIAQALGTSTASGGGVMIAASVGAVNGSSGVVGTANTVKGASGSAVGTSSAQSVVVVIFESSGMSLGVSDVEGVAAAIRSAIAASAGRATVSGITQGGVHYTAQGDSFNITLVFSASAYEIALLNNDYSVKLQPKQLTMELMK